MSEIVIGYEFKIDRPDGNGNDRISATTWTDARRQSDEMHGCCYVRVERWDPEWLCWLTEREDRI